MAYYYGILCIHKGLLYGRVAYYFGIGKEATLRRDDLYGILLVYKALQGLIRCIRGVFKNCTYGLYRSLPKPLDR